MTVSSRPLAFAFAMAIGLAVPHAASAEPSAKRPTAQELKALGDTLRNLLRTDVSDLTPVAKADGTVGLVLEDRFQTVTVAEIGADGAVASECLTSVSEADAWLARTAGDTTVQASAPAALEDR